MANVLGLRNEHERGDRDTYITVNSVNFAFPVSQADLFTGIDELCINHTYCSPDLDGHQRKSTDNNQSKIRIFQFFFFSGESVKLFSAVKFVPREDQQLSSCFLFERERNTFCL